VREPKVVSFKVTGAGHFPADMLRYDCCWPADGTSLARMTDRPEFHEKRSSFYDKSRTVSLRGIRQPTAARWSSFGWTVER
jgi:hypothetical protein